VFEKQKTYLDTMISADLEPFPILMENKLSLTKKMAQNKN
jgi:hypothetical protein